MELSSELIEIESKKERNILASYCAKVFAAFALVVGIVAIVLAVVFSGAA